MAPSMLVVVVVFSSLFFNLSFLRFLVLVLWPSVSIFLCGLSGVHNLVGSLFWRGSCGFIGSRFD